MPAFCLLAAPRQPGLRGRPRRGHAGLCPVDGREGPAEGVQAQIRLPEAQTPFHSRQVELHLVYVAKLQILKIHFC